MRVRQNPQVRIRMSEEQQRIIQRLAKESGMDFSEWISDRLALLTDDDRSTASKIAEMVVALWRIFEVLQGAEIDLQHPLAQKGLLYVTSCLANASNQKDLDAKRSAERTIRIIETLATARMERVFSIGRMLRSEKPENETPSA